ncbi:MAG: aspartate 1-decarboxylase, partial [Nitrospinales bacterium]
NLLDEVGILPCEQVHIYDIDNGNRFITYVITGKRGSGTFSVNGAAARMVQINDRIIVAAYGIIDTEKEKDFHPSVVLLDRDNQIVKS